MTRQDAAGEMTSVELVLFFGPPFVGKTLYYHKHYSKTHCRIAASEIFEQDESKNLRFVILQAAELLNQGKNVLIDDENWYLATRKSYSSVIKHKVPGCMITVVQFIPDASFGYKQCLWAREWTLVEWTMLEGGHEKRSLKLPSSDEKLNCWFARKRVSMSSLNPPEFPVATEGVSLVAVKPELMCNTSFEFNLPGLFVQWESIIEDMQADRLSLKTGTPEFMNQWVKKNPCGRLIIIGPKLRNDKEILEEGIKLVLLQLSSQVDFPIYFTFVDVKHQLDQYCQLPRPGVVAFLQKFHTINLHHKSTMLVYHTDEYYKAATTTGIRTIRGQRLLENVQLISAIHCGERTTGTLPFLKRLQEVNCQLQSKDRTEERQPAVPLVPFLARARQSSAPIVWKYCYGKVNGICFKDKPTLERYQTQYAMAAVRAALPGEILTSKNIETKKKKKKKTRKPDNAKVASTSTVLSDLFTLDNVNLQEIAETPGRYQAGFICKHKIFDFETHPIEKRLKILSKCMGSTDTSYDVQAILSDSSGLISSHCSCPDPASQTGRCKHVIGLLLYYQDLNALPKPVDRQRKRQSTLKESWKSDEQKFQTPVSTKRGTVNTLYCMSQDELLQTAREVIQKHETALSKSKQITTNSPTCAEQSSKVDETSKSESSTSLEQDVIPDEEMEPQSLPMEDGTNMERNIAKDDLEELLFGPGQEKKRRRKVHCSASFADETPEDEMPKQCKETLEQEASVIVPDSLVLETITLVPETEPTSITDLPSDETIRNIQAKQGKPSRTSNQSFEDFLDELM